MANRNTFYIQQIDIQKKLFNVTLHTFIYSIAVFFITASMLNFECIPICIMDLHKIHEQYRSRYAKSNHIKPNINVFLCLRVCVCYPQKRNFFNFNMNFIQFKFVCWNWKQPKTDTDKFGIQLTLNCHICKHAQWPKIIQRINATTMTETNTDSVLHCTSYNNKSNLYWFIINLLLPLRVYCVLFQRIIAGKMHLVYVPKDKH